MLILNQFDSMSQCVTGGCQIGENTQRAGSNFEGLMQSYSLEVRLELQNMQGAGDVIYVHFLDVGVL